MNTKDLPQLGNPILRRKSKPVLEKDLESKETKEIIRALISCMRKNDLVGMAAPQLGINKRIFVSEIRETETRKNGLDGLRVFINPEIIETSKVMHTSYESCGSVLEGNLFGPVKRPSAALISYINEKGEKLTLQSSGLLARVMQHEYDHLEGVLFIDRVENNTELLSRGEYLKKLDKEEQEQREKEALKLIKQFEADLPKFKDERINYTHAKSAPVLSVFVKHKDEILLLKRSDKVLAYKGKWCNNGGFLDEIKPIKTKILEELTEELGITEKNIKKLKVGKSHTLNDKEINREWIFHPAIIELWEKPEINLNWEHTEYKWTKAEELRELKDTVPNLEENYKKAAL